jgi:tetratricopeptide (TPR) repeat protein
VRERELARADTAFESLASYAHAKSMSQVEADTCLQMAMYQPRYSDSLALLDKAEKALLEGKSATTIGVQQETAKILRARVELAMKAGDRKGGNAALAKLAELSLDSDDKVIDSAYHGALGAHLFDEHRYKEALAHLEEDSDSPLSLERLATVYLKTGYITGAKHVEQMLATFSDPTVEQALVVPAFRQCLQSSTCNISMRNVSLTR